jgi:6-phosphofructokinase 1
VSSNVYGLEMMTKMFKEEGGKLFDSRSAQLGHTLQGKIPSPLDRTRAVRLAIKAMTFIEQTTSAEAKRDPSSAVVVAIKGTKIDFVPVREAATFADFKARRGKHVWWIGLKEVVEALVARPQIL